MNILVVSASLPYPPQQGGALRTYGLLKGLHDAGHAITLLAFHQEDEVPAPLLALCERVETFPAPGRSRDARLKDLFLSRQADIAQRLYRPDFLAKLSALCASEQPDLVQFEGIEVACYLPLLKAAGVKARLCYDAFNAEADLQWGFFRIDIRQLRRWPQAAYSFVQARRIARFEHQLCQTADLTLAVSPEDARLLASYTPVRAPQVVPNGIFTQDYDATVDPKDLGQHALVFTGKMDYRPNVDAALWFADKVLPLIRTHAPDVPFVIVGQRPHAALERLRTIPGVTLTGFVPAIQPYLRGAAIYVAPLRMGSGTRLKMLEAMAMGCAVVATPMAVSGMHNDLEATVRVAKDARSMAAAITELLLNADLRRGMGEAARIYVESHYDWAVITPRLLAAYRSIGLE